MVLLIENKYEHINDMKTLVFKNHGDIKILIIFVKISNAH